MSFHYLLYFIQMKNDNLQRIALRYRALYLNIEHNQVDPEAKPNPPHIGLHCSIEGKRLLRK